MKKVIVAMSGGVDSSVAAYLLKKKGYDVTGAMMLIWDGSMDVKAKRHACYSPEENDIKDAKKVARKLAIPFHLFDLKEEYRKFVLEYFYKEYLSGRTPNPCVRCNKMVKLGFFIEKIKNVLEFDYIATGHYARVKYDEKRRRYLLLKAKDKRKDQSYGLYLLSQNQLKNLILPIGDYTKERVRKIAMNIGMEVSRKQESQDFVAEGYRKLFERVAKPGPIFNTDGEIIGEHRGIPFYTVGQRRGIGIQSEKPLYVIRIDAEKNAIVVGTKEELYKKQLTATNLNWIAIEELKKPLKVKAKIRHHHQEAAATVEPIDYDMVLVKFHRPQMAVTPGQSVVFYERDMVIGGGTIEG